MRQQVRETGHSPDNIFLLVSRGHAAPPCIDSFHDSMADALAHRLDHQRAMTAQDYNRLYRRYWLEQPLRQMSRREFEVLSVAQWVSKPDGLCLGFVRDDGDGYFCRQVAEYAGRHYSKFIDPRDASTWITTSLIARGQKCAMR